MQFLDALFGRMVPYSLLLCFFASLLSFVFGPLVSGISTYLPSMLMLSKVAKSGQPSSRTQ